LLDRGKVLPYTLIVTNKHAKQSRKPSVKYQPDGELPAGRRVKGSR